MRSTGFRSGSRQAAATEWLDAHDRPDHVSIDIDISRARLFRNRPRAAIDSGMYAHRQAVTQSIDGVHGLREFVA